MKDIELCKKCEYGRIIVKDNQIYGRTYEFPISEFIKNKENNCYKNDSNNSCYDFKNGESSIIRID